MEALKLSSRAVVQDRFFQKDQEEKYRRHQASMKTIYGERNGQLQEWQKEVDNVASTLRKSKTTSKLFREKEEKSHLKGENMSLLKRIWNLQPSVKTYHQDRYQYSSGSNWSRHKKDLDQIREQNKILVLKMNQQHVDPVDYKKKLKEEIKSYLQLREGIRKVKADKSNSAKQQKKQTTGVRLDKLQGHRKTKGEDTRKNRGEQEGAPNPEQKS